MDKQNICNFNFNRSSDLVCVNFVCEKNDSQAYVERARRNEIGIVIDGKGVFSCGGRSHDLYRGALFFVNQGRSFSVCSENREDGLEYCYISFNGRRGDELMERAGIADGNNVFYGYERLAAFWLDCLSSVNEGNVDLISEAVLLYSLAMLNPEKAEQTDLITKMISVSGEYFTDSDFNLQSLADKIGYDEKYLSSVFKKQKGITYSRYLRELRINHAMFLMEQGIVSVKNIALLCGFGDPLYFSKVFKEEEGKTPKEYIKYIELRKGE